jgi:hypothetical protein
MSALVVAGAAAIVAAPMLVLAAAPAGAGYDHVVLGRLRTCAPGGTAANTRRYMACRRHPPRVHDHPPE